MGCVPSGFAVGAYDWLRGGGGGSAFSSNDERLIAQRLCGFCGSVPTEACAPFVLNGGNPTQHSLVEQFVLIHKIRGFQPSLAVFPEVLIEVQLIINRGSIAGAKQTQLERTATPQESMWELTR